LGKGLNGIFEILAAIERHLYVSATLTLKIPKILMLKRLRRELGPIKNEFTVKPCLKDFFMTKTHLTLALVA